MYNLTRGLFLSLAILVFLLISACGPNQTDLDGTATQDTAAQHSTQTALAPTDTPIPTSTPSPLPTDTPTPTATFTPTPTYTPTPTPDPDPSAMLDWRTLNLPQGYVALPPGNIGIEPGAMAFGMTVDDEPVIYSIESSFAMSNDDGETSTIFGYTTVLPEKVDQDRFDGYMAASADPDFMTSTIGSSYPGSTNIQAEELPLIENLGDENAGISVGFTFGGNDMRMDSYTYRLDDVGVDVFVRYLDTEGPPVTAEALALAYPDSINRGYQGCSHALAPGLRSHVRHVLEKYCWFRVGETETSAAA